MPVEAELKARVHQPDHLHTQLARRANPVRSVYRDTYYDWPDGTFTSTGRELRLRIVDTDQRHRTVIALEKHCTNYRFTERGRDLLATVVHVPELDGHFVELETLVAEPGVASALDDIRAVLADLGVNAGELTAEQYTDAVRERRRSNQG